jgi:ketosteroid isomerase-like protein
VSSQAEENMALARRFMEARIKGDLEAVDEMMAPTTSTTPHCFPSKSPTAKTQFGLSPNSLPPSPTPAYTSRTR